MKTIKKVGLIIIAVSGILLAILDVKTFAMSAGVSTNGNYSLAKKQALEQKSAVERSYNKTKTIAVFSLYLPYIYELEHTVSYFKHCGVITNPKVKENFISNVNTKYGLDLYALEYLKSKAEIGAKNKMLKQAKVKKYMLCIASYGLIIAQAFKNFGGGLSGGGIAIANETYKISSNRFYDLVGSSITDAIGHQDLRLRTEFKDIKRQINNHTCVLYGNSFKCGGVYLDISGTPKMSWGGLDWYNPQSDFAGRNDVIEIGYNKNNSYSSTQSKDRALNWINENTNNIASDLINSLF